jgi:hypothetical protein
MERVENDSTVFHPSHKTLKIDETDFHIPTATTTTEQSFHLKPEKPVQTNGAAASVEFLSAQHGIEALDCGNDNLGIWIDSV